MDRRNFLKNTCTACLSVTVFSSLVTGCVSTRFITGKIGTNGLTIRKDDFLIRQKGRITYSSFVIIRNDALLFPVCVYRLSDQEYTALWMKCSHQGAILQASGNVLQCSAHGSEFNNKGEVKTGPANANLKNFPITVTNNDIFIDLRKLS